MSKGSAERISETIKFLKDAKTGTFAGDRTAIIEALENWTNADKGKAIALSSKMSQENVTNRSKTKPLRAYRRSLILLKCAIGKPKKQNEWDAEVKMVNLQKDAALPDMLGHELSDARDKLGSLPARVAPMVNELLSNPSKFLLNNILTIAGKKDSNAYSYGFYMTKGGYKIDPFDWVENHQKIRAINVPAILFKDVRDSINAIPGTRSSDTPDAAVMFTTQFTGCTYCFSVNGGSMVAAHIDPGGGIGRTSEFDGVGISKELREGGGFANGNGGEFKAYGRVANNDFGYPEDADQMTIVAVRSNEQIWGVYAQVVVAGKVKSADKIS